MKIFAINKRIVSKDKAVIPIDSDAFQRGYGVFETLRTFKKQPFRLPDHLTRLFQSAKKIGIQPQLSKQEIIETLQRVIKKSPHQNQRLKIIAIPEKIIIISQPVKINPKIYQGVKCITVQRERAIPEVKSISYLPSLLSNQQAKAKGAYEAILVNPDGEVFEGAYSNIFWFEGDTLCTRKDGILPGITRKHVIKNWSGKLHYKNITLPALLKANGIFLTQSVSGIVPVKQIDGVKIKSCNHYLEADPQNLELR